MSDFIRVFLICFGIFMACAFILFMIMALNRRQ